MGSNPIARSIFTPFKTAVILPVGEIFGARGRWRRVWENRWNWLYYTLFLRTGERPRANPFGVAAINLLLRRSDSGFKGGDRRGDQIEDSQVLNEPCLVRLVCFQDVPSDH